MASVVGPLVGGALSQHASWRWCFWINLPTGGIAMILLFVFLHLNPGEKTTFREFLLTFDFLGLFLFSAGIVLFLIGFQGAETAKNGWRSAQTIAPLVIGGILITLAIIYEFYTTREPIVPPRLFRTRTTAAILIGAFIQSLIFFVASYYVPLYFQILGSSATMAGIRQLPFTLGSIVLAIVTGIIVSKTGRYRPVIWIGYLISTVGVGLLVLLEENTSHAKQEIFLLIAGIGLGALLQAPRIGLQAAMPIKDMATSTGVYALLR